MTMPQIDLVIREYQPGDEWVFRKLNEWWIVRYFALEEKDLEALNDPQASILDHGGRIFFAVRQGEPVGCCALIAKGKREFELAKMAVAESCQGGGIGRRLLESTIAAARTAGVARLYLETNRKLENAIRLYESVGFRHVPSERVVPSPYARADIYMEMYL